MFILDLKKNHHYTIKVKPDKDLDVQIFLIDKDLTIWDEHSNEPEEDNYCYSGDEREVELKPYNTGRYYLVVIDYWGKGKAHIVICDDFDIV